MPNKLLTEAGLGVREAMEYWLSQHPISMGEILAESFSRAVRVWLDEHHDEVIEAIAEHAKV